MIEKIIEIAQQAGEVLSDGFGKSLEIEYKTGETNIVTQYDKKSEKLILEYIEKNFPTHSILGEEGTNKDKGSEYLWVVDPLDGTTNFAHGLPIFSVSIGVLKGNEIIAGVVYDVMNKIIYSAEKGSGSFANGKNLNVNSNKTLSHAVLVTGFPYNISENPDRAIEKFAEMVKKTRAVRRLGSAAIDLCYVAKGIFDAFWEVYLHPWDMAAGILVVNEAGGTVTNFNNQPADIYTKQMLASNKVIHSQVLDILNEA